MDFKSATTRWAVRLEDPDWNLRGRVVADTVGEFAGLPLTLRRSGELIRALSRLMPDWSITAVLNGAGKRTGRGNTWTEARVRTFRSDHQIAVYRDGERADRGELSLEEAAAALATSKMTVLRLIRSGVIAARQICKGAPWIIERRAIDDPAIVTAVRTGRRGSVTPNPDQKAFVFQ